MTTADLVDLSADMPCRGRGWSESDGVSLGTEGFWIDVYLFSHGHDSTSLFMEIYGGRHELK